MKNNAENKSCTYVLLSYSIKKNSNNSNSINRNVYLLTLNNTNNNVIIIC